MFNFPSSVKLSSNKIESFNAFKLLNVKAVPSTTIRDEAISWIEEGSKVVARAIISGSQGNGITICKTISQLPLVPLYTRYIEKQREFRVHVIFGEVVHIQQKRRLSSEQLEIRGIFSRNKYIRNIANGYIFSTDLDLDPLSTTYNDVVDNSLRAIVSLGLDFGGVDIIITKSGEVLVLEVNSACGLEGVTLGKYVSRFKEYLNLE
jgi:glutathione synthase/RimK-type ligase-like ATP-grasp enzyme